MKTISIFLKSDMWSNLFFILPLVVAYELRSVFMAVLIAAVFVFSSLYHLSGEKKYKKLDHFFAMLLILGNSILVAFGGFTAPYFHSIVLATLFALYFYNRDQVENYERNHAWWHSLSSLITLLSLFTFYL